MSKGESTLEEHKEKQKDISLYKNTMSGLSNDIEWREWHIYIIALWIFFIMFDMNIAYNKIFQWKSTIFLFCSVKVENLIQMRRKLNLVLKTLLD
jgi:hypothetical protein